MNSVYRKYVLRKVGFIQACGFIDHKSSEKYIIKTGKIAVHTAIAVCCIAAIQLVDLLQKLF
jgi:hypothetical protein